MGVFCDIYIFLQKRFSIVLFTHNNTWNSFRYNFLFLINVYYVTLSIHVCNLLLLNVYYLEYNPYDLCTSVCVVHVCDFFVHVGEVQR